MARSVNHTVLKDKLMPKTWKCPHCGKRNKSGRYADWILLGHGRYLEHCGCGCVHSFELELTEEFMDKVIEACQMINWEEKLP